VQEATPRSVVNYSKRPSGSLIITSGAMAELRRRISKPAWSALLVQESRKGREAAKKGYGTCNNGLFPPDQSLITEMRHNTANLSWDCSSPH
jgi:hypothetical protein